MVRECATIVSYKRRTHIWITFNITKERIRIRKKKPSCMWSHKKRKIKNKIKWNGHTTSDERQQRWWRQRGRWQASTNESTPPPDFCRFFVFFFLLSTLWHCWFIASPIHIVVVSNVCVILHGTYKHCYCAKRYVPHPRHSVFRSGAKKECKFIHGIEQRPRVAKVVCDFMYTKIFTL